VSGIVGRDDGDLKKYRTEVPNVVFMLGLDPYSLALYCHIKRTTGAAEGGMCWKSTRTLAEETGMSVGKVSEARAELEKPRDELGGKPLIVVNRPKNRGKATEVICVDVWRENFDACSPDEQRVHHTNTERSPHEPKKEPFKKEPVKNSPTGDGEPSAGSFVAYLRDEVHGADVPLMRARESRYAGEFKKLIKKGITEDVLYKVCDRIAERWRGDEHRKLTAEQALEDVVNGRPPKHVSEPARLSAARRKAGYEWLFDERDEPKRDLDAELREMRRKEAS
jgi:hypothetical protein